MESQSGIRVEGLCLAELIEMTETPVIEGSADLTWDETHHLLVPLLRADNHTNILYILGDYAGLATSLRGLRLDLSIVVGGTAARLHRFCF